MGLCFGYSHGNSPARSDKIMNGAFVLWWGSYDNNVP
jgi:hypothetical protein